jgi:hypothetical protein
MIASTYLVHAAGKSSDGISEPRKTGEGENAHVSPH